jgi:tRNA U34 5-methylaminomethyl-2-thiouridine-forming methyltransferase MnmC
LKKVLITTKDGSKTIHFPEWNESYHSQHGAITEALHVYIESGLAYRLKSKPQETIRILEMGFGTGLNTYLTYTFARENNLNLNYTSIEKYPVSDEEIRQLNYVKDDEKPVFRKLHQVPWGDFHLISDRFQLKKLKIDIDAFQTNDLYDVIYFDAFGPRVQPHLWHNSILENMYHHLNSEGVWVTYCCKGSVRRDLIEIGFQVEKIPGPPGKREMLRAVKP